MGKTISSYFSNFKSDELAQFYIHSQVPTSSICTRYFRITDKEAICSIFSRRAGCEFTGKDIDINLQVARTDKGILASLYQKARKRTPMVYLLRNIWWKLAHWNNKRFNQWIEEFDPDGIFLASGDYAFIYDIALKIAQKRRIPLFVSCMDDYYYYNKNSDRFLGVWQHDLFMKSVKKTMDYASAIFCICDKMTRDYEMLFNKTCITVHTPATIQKPLKYDKKKQICYLGNLGYKRNEQLITIGKVIKTLNLQPNVIDVYSTETNQDVLRELVAENGIIFHGAIGIDDVIQVIGESIAVIHTESFDEKRRKSVEYSISTKIADSLVSGTCIFAYGPPEIASMSYLANNNAAICCTKEEELKQGLYNLIQNEDLRERTIANAQLLAKNHLQQNTPLIIRNIMNNVLATRK